MSSPGILLSEIFIPSRRLRKFAFLRKNEVWAAVWVTDILTVPFTVLLTRFWCFYPFLSPNALSLFSFLTFYTGIALAYMLPSQMILTALCFILSVFFDDIDGKFARATGQTSFFGAGLDLVIDLLNHTLGLILFGLVLGARTGSLVPFLVLCPFAFFMGALHINALARTFTPTPGEKEDDPACFGSAWRTFCDARGLVYNPYSLYEVYLLIVLVGPWLERPAVFFAGVIAVFFLLCVIRRVMLVRAASRTGQEGVAC